ncbi:uncharacterized protein [Miscanthus floridulus]
MHLVNTFEERFDDLDGYSEEHARVKLLASSTSNSVVSLASFEGNVRRFTCTGTIFRHTPYEMTILTSASLVRCLGNEAKFVNKLKIKVCLPNGKLAVGKLWKYDCNYNIAVVKTKSFPEFHGVQFNSELFQTNLVAIGRCYESGQLMSSSGMLLHKNSILDCQELMVSTCKITKAGIGGPLIDSSGNFVGMNIYSEDETPFLPVSILLKCFKHFEISGWKTCFGSSCGENGVVLENSTPTSLGKMSPSLLNSLFLTVIVVVRPTCFNRDIQTQRFIASTHAVVLMPMRSAFSFSGSTVQTSLTPGTSFSTIGGESDIQESTSSGGFHLPLTRLQ